jgi:hypothetical protein
MYDPVAVRARLKTDNAEFTSADEQFDFVHGFFPGTVVDEKLACMLTRCAAAGRSLSFESKLFFGRAPALESGAS